MPIKPFEALAVVVLAHCAVVLVAPATVAEQDETLELLWELQLAEWRGVRVGEDEMEFEAAQSMEQTEAGWSAEVLDLDFA